MRRMVWRRALTAGVAMMAVGCSQNDTTEPSAPSVQNEATSPDTLVTVEALHEFSGMDGIRPVALVSGQIIKNGVWQAAKTLKIMPRVELPADAAILVVNDGGEISEHRLTKAGVLLNVLSAKVELGISLDNEALREHGLYQHDLMELGLLEIAEVDGIEVEEPEPFEVGFLPGGFGPRGPGGPGKNVRTDLELRCNTERRIGQLTPNGSVVLFDCDVNVTRNFYINFLRVHEYNLFGPNGPFPFWNMPDVFGDVQIRVTRSNNGGVINLPAFFDGGVDQQAISLGYNGVALTTGLNRIEVIATVNAEPELLCRPNFDGSEPLECGVNEYGDRRYRYCLDRIQVSGNARGDQPLENQYMNLERCYSFNLDLMEDDDADGASNNVEIDNGTDPDNPDTDGDGLLDGYEIDNGFDPLTPGEEVLDPDNDGVNNADEQELGLDPTNPDSDGDGLSDGDELNVHDTNPLQVDSDGDGLGDGDEINVHGTDPTLEDTDEDGLTDGYELNTSLTDPANEDTDGDGMLDGWELQYNFNPLVDDGAGDNDNDGLTNAQESQAGSSPFNRDTDNDGLTDAEEFLEYGTDPTNRDTDGGGREDLHEVLGDLTDPLDEADDLTTVNLTYNLFDGDGYRWDVGGNGYINDGSNDAYNGGMSGYVNGSGFNWFQNAVLEMDGRQLRIGPFRIWNTDLVWIRHVFVPDTPGQGYVRYLEEITNVGDNDYATRFEIRTNMGSGNQTVYHATSSGDQQYSTLDNWAVTDDLNDGAGDPSLAHVYGDDDVDSIQPSNVSGGTNNQQIYTRWNMTVPAGERMIFMHFASQNANRATALASAETLANLGEDALQGLESETLDDIVNWKAIPDTDGDGLNDEEEVNVGTDPNNPDTDADGMPDGWEVEFGIDPLVDDAGLDPDMDGLINEDEYLNGSSPTSSDADMDGLNDGEELLAGTNPLQADTDSDGLDDGDELNIHMTDPVIADTDGGGQSDGDEVNLDGTDPNNPADDIAPVALPHTLNDENNFIWDIQRDGNISNGTSDAYDGGMRGYLNGNQMPQQPAGQLELNSRQIRFPKARPGNIGIAWQRRVYVPTAESYARYLEYLYNETNEDIQFTFELRSNLGSDGNTNYHASSSGDGPYTVADYWFCSDDNDNQGDPAMAHVLGDGNGLGASFVSTNGDNFTTRWTVTVPANSHRILMHFAAQHRLRVDSIATAEALANLERDALFGIPEDDLAEIVNWEAVDAEDSDGDGMPDDWELLFELDPMIDDSALDPDADDLTNLDEFTLGTNPTNEDTDGDQLPDGWEFAYDLNPLVDDADQDADMDGLVNSDEYIIDTDPQNEDSDGDSLTDGDEVNIYGSDPTLVDTDGGGTNDNREVLIDMTDPTDPLDDVAPSYADECDLANHEILDSIGRGVNIDGGEISCDGQLYPNGTWFRLIGEDGNRMPDQNEIPEQRRCGTHATGWLDADHPADGEHLVNTRICYNWGANTCNWSAATEVINCGDFFIYQFNKPPACHLRICATEAPLAP